MELINLCSFKWQFFIIDAFNIFVFVWMFGLMDLIFGVMMISGQKAALSAKGIGTAKCIDGTYREVESLQLELVLASADTGDIVDA